jgi:hypothetical protein
MLVVVVSGEVVGKEGNLPTSRHDSLVVVLAGEKGKTHQRVVKTRWWWCGQVAVMSPAIAVDTAAVATITVAAAAAVAAVAAKLGGGRWWQPASCWTPLMVMLAVVVDGE